MGNLSGLCRRTKLSIVQRLLGDQFAFVQQFSDGFADPFFVLLESEKSPEIDCARFALMGNERRHGPRQRADEYLAGNQAVLIDIEHHAGRRRRWFAFRGIQQGRVQDGARGFDQVGTVDDAGEQLIAVVRPFLAFDHAKLFGIGPRHGIGWRTNCQFPHAVSQFDRGRLLGRNVFECLPEI